MVHQRRLFNPDSTKIGAQGQRCCQHNEDAWTCLKSISVSKSTSTRPLTQPQDAAAASFPTYGRYTLIGRLRIRQMGHLSRDSEQPSHAHMCPHAVNTVSALPSRQITHVSLSRSPS